MGDDILDLKDACLCLYLSKSIKNAGIKSLLCICSIFLLPEGWFCTTSGQGTQHASPISSVEIKLCPSGHVSMYCIFSVNFLSKTDPWQRGLKDTNWPDESANDKCFPQNSQRGRGDSDLLDRLSSSCLSATVLFSCSSHMSTFMRWEFLMTMGTSSNMCSKPTQAFFSLGKQRNSVTKMQSVLMANQ